MKKVLLSFLVSVIVGNVFSNNARVTNVQRLDNGGLKNVISFDVAWDNSWNVGGTPGNHDALWTFIKFRECGVGGTWTHGLLSTDIAADYTFASNVTFADSVRLTNRAGVLPAGATESNGLGHNTGILIRRSDVGVGHITGGTCTVTLTNPTAQLDPGKTYDIRVFVIEMVQVKEEGFAIGDGGSPNTFNQIAIDNELGLGADALYAGSAALPNEFPKGYTMFYCMKYEISQSQFAHFLNHSNPAGGSPLGYYGVNRCWIGPGSNGYESIMPCNAQNYMQWSDLLSYLDWAALRPMTELEYEKVALGPPGSGAAPTYAWGNSSVVKAWVISQSTEDGTEYVHTLNANAHYYSTHYISGNTIRWGSAYTGTWSDGNFNVLNAPLNPSSGAIIKNASPFPLVYSSARNYQHTFPVLSAESQTSTSFGSHGFGPIGVGIFARDTTLTRMTTGGSYYGAMELSGNVSEQCVDVASTGYQGNWGNGYLTGGYSDVADWPLPTDARAIRGGGYGSDLARLGVADRNWVGSTVGRTGPYSQSYRQGEVGGRGVR